LLLCWSFIDISMESIPIKIFRALGAGEQTVSVLPSETERKLITEISQWES
jgi:hypothetical protein